MRRKNTVMLPVFVLLTCVLAACGGGGGGGGTSVGAIGKVPAAGDIVLNEILPAPTTDANGDGAASSANDEFVELVSTATDTLDLGGVTVSSSSSVKHTFAAGAVLGPKGVAVIFSGGTPTAISGVTVQTASTGSLSLTNSGATITIKNAAGTTIDTAPYPASTNDVSFNRDPELTGAFALHTSIAGSSGNYSPGRKANGAAF